MFYHRNSGETAFDLAVRQQKLEGVKGELWNPLPGLIYGGRLSGDGMVVYDQVSGKYASTPFRAWRLKSVRPSKKHHIQVVFHTQKRGTEKDWKTGLVQVEQEIGEMRRKSKEKTLDWWKKFRDATQPVFEELYREVAAGNEAQRSIDLNSKPDYREKLNEELREMRENEMWQTGAVVRKLRPENN